jgi:hypothetical protein
MADFVRVNDSIYSWNSCRFILGLTPYIGVKSLDFADSIDAPLVYAARRDGVPLGTPSGKYAVGDVKLVMLRDSADAWTSELALLAPAFGGLPGDVGVTRFPIVVQVSEVVPSLVGLPIQTSVLETCRIIGQHEAQDEGTGELVTEFTIRALQLTRNGKRLWSAARTLP